MRFQGADDPLAVVVTRELAGLYVAEFDLGGLSERMDEALTN